MIQFRLHLMHMMKVSEYRGNEKMVTRQNLFEIQYIMVATIKLLNISLNIPLSVDTEKLWSCI